MPFVQEYPFTTPGNYTVQDSVVSGGLLQLIKTEASSNKFALSAYDTPGNYTISADAEVSGGLGQMSVVDADVTASADYGTDEDLTYSRDGGSLTGTLSGGASVGSGELTIPASSDCYYAATDNFDTMNDTFTIRFGYKPGYSGSPPATQWIVNYYGDAPGTGYTDITDLIWLQHTNAGTWNVQIRGDGDVIHNGVIPSSSWSPTAGQEYEIELNMDITNEVMQLFIDGVQVGSTISSFTNTTLRTGLTGTWSFNRGNSAGDFSLNYFQVFDTVQHTAGYTPAGLTSPYSATDQTIESTAFEISSADLNTLVSFASTGEVGSPRWIFSRDSGVTWEYWNGAAWATSDESYAQAASQADSNTNIATLKQVGDTTILYAVVFQGGVIAEVADATLTYTDLQYPTGTTVDAGYATPTATFNSDSIISVTTVENETGGSVRYIMCVGGQNRYWSGAAWANSDGTWAQANTPADLAANITTLLTLGTPQACKPVPLLRSTTGAATPDVDDVQFNYNQSQVAPGVETLCQVHWTPRDTLGVNYATVTAFVRPQDGQRWIEVGNTVQVPSEQKFTPEDNGTIEMDLVQGSTMRLKYTYIDAVSGKTKTVSKDSTGEKLDFTVPNAVDVDLRTLLPAL